MIQCSHWDGILPYITSYGTEECDYSTIPSYIPPPTTTNTFDTFAEFPYTITLPNSAVVAYATTTPFGGAGLAWTVAGSSTTVQAGMSMTVNMNGTQSVNAGLLTGNALYTSISDALMSVCPSPKGTITSCTAEPVITSISYVDEFHDLRTNEELIIHVDWALYHDPDVLESLIMAVANVMRSSSLRPENTADFSYCFGEGGEVNKCTDGSAPGDWPKVKLTNVPKSVQAIFTEQDGNTDGKVDFQQLQVSFRSALLESPFLCAMAAFAWDTVAVMTDGIAMAVGPAVMSCNCLMDDLSDD